MTETLAPGRSALPPELVATAHPDRLAARLDPRLSVRTLERLRATPRIRARLAGLLLAPSLAGRRAEGGQGDGAETDVARAILVHPPELMARLAGAAWHGAALKLLISGKSVAAVAGRIGPDAFGFGLRNADLAVAPTDLHARPDDLAVAIGADGLRCLGLTLLRMPRDVAVAVLVRLPPGTVAERVGDDPDAATSAASIMARVLVHLGGAPTAGEAGDA